MSKSQEWYTPPFITTRVKDYFGRIDLDPCSNIYRSVPAKKHIIGEAGEDGLKADWDGVVFINPPWNNIKPWAEKAIQEVDKHNHFFMLVPNRTETAWFQLLIASGAKVCLFDSIVNYCKWEDGKLVQKKGIQHGSVLFYIGYNPHLFKHSFRKYGVIL